MDISLMAIDTAHSTVHWSGANNPLWIFRKDGTFEEIKGDKQPIGSFSHAKPFTSHQTKVEKGDTLYLFTDGFADQFGGEKGKKMKSSNFRELLRTLHNKPLAHQEIRLLDAFNEWKNDFEQLDDVCIIGVRI